MVCSWSLIMCWKTHFLCLIHLPHFNCTSFHNTFCSSLCIFPWKWSYIFEQTCSNTGIRSCHHFLLHSLTFLPKVPKQINLVVHLHVCFFFLCLDFCVNKIQCVNRCINHVQDFKLLLRYASWYFKKVT